MAANSSRLKSNLDIKSIPVVILTTSSHARDVEECYATGANGYMEKSVDFDRFTAMIRVFKKYWFDKVLLPGTRMRRTISS